MLTSMENMSWLHRTSAQPEPCGKVHSVASDDPFMPPINDHKAAAGKNPGPVCSRPCPWSTLCPQGQVPPKLTAGHAAGRAQTLAGEVITELLRQADRERAAAVQKASRHAVGATHEGWQQQPAELADVDAPTTPRKTVKRAAQKVRSLSLHMLVGGSCHLPVRAATART